MFADDAVVASAILEVVLTRRKNSVDGEIPMCGVPYAPPSLTLSRLTQERVAIFVPQRVGWHGVAGVYS